MDYFEKDGVVYKNVPAGGHGGGVTSSVPVKASDDEAAAFRAAQAPAEAPLPDHEPPAPEAAGEAQPAADATS